MNPEIVETYWQVQEFNYGKWRNWSLKIEDEEGAIAYFHQATKNSKLKLRLVKVVKTVVAVMEDR